ncbi:electron transfer flavoprotein beta subunit [Angulomicrobium tetraedrale]|uniref:Electron transfer flavoprotein beta subunit n=1 Tax=Ancylobacter tetraedralis TaxID=217068 RepID=A0A839ZCC3_9HYPH|nr:electron transfer flavoprotein subunit beta [Ancylobacter tetraedralis]MBB3772379.1 electron transfer flavoprotein beta subunit [Ancylobacter tetraedralis]
MRIAILLSAGRHAVSGRPAPVSVELQAIRLARELIRQMAGEVDGNAAGDITGFHAGPDAGPLKDALGHGLPRLIQLSIGAQDDPLPSLAAALGAERFDLVLAGRSGQGGEDAGLLPYALARTLGLPIVADACALAAGPQHGTVSLEQALPRGARRRLTLRLPALVTVHPAAPAPLPFAFAAMRRGMLETREGVPAPRAAGEVEERAYRARPKLIAKSAAGASATERLKAATEAASSGGRLIVDPAPEDAARAILAHLRQIGVLRD